MRKQVEITSKGIKSVLKRYKYSQAIVEYIWNGFDAKATCVEMTYSANEIGNISSIQIKDNGYGIQHDLLESKFSPFFESEKLSDFKESKHHSAIHGKNGVGRLTFFTFASNANWETIFCKNGKFYRYNVGIKKESLQSYTQSKSELAISENKDTGTVVTFSGIFEVNEGKLKSEFLNYLKLEFGWFLELNRHKGFSIKINGEQLDYSSVIGEQDKAKFIHRETGVEFNVLYIRWHKEINREFSRYYYQNSNKDEVWKDYTTLNKKSDSFYHSIFIQSSYFDNFNFLSDENNNQQAIVGGKKSDEQFRYLQSELTNYLRRKRKPFLKENSYKLIEEYENENVFPEFKENEWEAFRKDELKSVIRGLYETQPKIFSALNIEQKKAFVGFLNLLLDSDERERILFIIRKIVDLDEIEREELAELLKSTKLSRVIKTINIVKDRYKIIKQLKELVFNEGLGANERDHIQKIVECHYWIFGEQYYLISAAEPRFEEVLRRFIYLMRGDGKKVKIDHPDKNKEMDIFLCKQNKMLDTVENIVVELKHPKVKLGDKELNQVKGYLDVIIKQDDFNGNNIFWNFYLVGNSFDTSGRIERELENSKTHGERSLAFKTDRYRIYVKKWSEVFTELECRYKYLEDSLEVEREEFTKEYKDANEIIKLANKSSARVKFGEMSLMRVMSRG
jgi:hypothetical protein